MKRMFHMSGHAAGLICAMLISVIINWPVFARAQEKPARLVLMVDPVQTQGTDQEEAYAYRKVNHERIISLMLYGLRDQQQNGDAIAKTRKNLGGFFKQHLDSFRHDYLGQNDLPGMRIMTGESAFTSIQINRGLDTAPAKMAGFTLPFGKATFGGGYLWGEKNPAVMMPKADGLFAGFSYDTGSTGFQISYITAGQNVAGFNVGGTNIQYNSILFGTSFKVNQRLSLTATMQYRNDEDPLTTGAHAGVITLGTRWKF